MRICVKCGETKEIDLFRIIGKWRSHTCKKCYSAKYVTGKENTGRLKKGHTLNKGIKYSKERIEQMRIARIDPESQSRQSYRYQIWRLSVLNRDSET